jgi:hypothetical protein
MKTQIILLLIAAAGTAFITGCATNTRVIAPGGTESVRTVGQINIQDFINAAQAMSDDLLASGVLDKVPNPPAVLAISRIVPQVGGQIDTTLLTTRIRIALNKSGKAVTDVTSGLGGPEDPLADANKRTDVFRGNTTLRPPDFTLSGKIIETTARDGRTRQSTYTFHLALTDKQGLAVWEGEKEITKQKTGGVVSPW